MASRHEFLQSKLSEFVLSNLARVQALVITKVNDEINKILLELLNDCPPPDRLERLARIVKNLRPPLTKAEENLEQARKVADILEPAIDAAVLILLFLTYNPLPVVSFNGQQLPLQAVPPTGGILKSRTQGQENDSSAMLKWYAEFIKMLQDEGRAIAQGVQATEGLFDPIINALETIDALIQACLTNQDLSDEERKLLVDSIQSKLNDELSITGISYVSKKSGRTYTIKVIQDPESPDIAPKRQAIVQDFRDITVLTGPSSFASDPDILVEEIKFRIENQLP